MYPRLTSSQRVVAKVFAQKFPLSQVFDRNFTESIERFIVDFDGLITKLSFGTVMDFVKKHQKGTSKDHSVEIRNILCALCIFMTDDLTSFWTMETMQAAFQGVPEFDKLEESEWERLLKYQAIVKTSHDLFGSDKQKGRVLFIANHLTGVEVTDDSLHGQKFATGSGASKAAKRRCMIYQRISGVAPESRKPADSTGKKRSLEEVDALPPTATEEQRREYEETVAKLNEIKRRAAQSHTVAFAPEPVAVSPPLPPVAAVPSSSAVTFAAGTYYPSSMNILVNTSNELLDIPRSDFCLSGMSVLDDFDFN